MAFIKRTWLARLGTGLNKFLISDKGADGKQTLTNSPDTVVQEGDVISADNLNDLEDRIADGLDEKQNVLTFDNVPTSGSNNPVKSGGIYSAIKEVADDVTNMKLKKIWENPNPNSAYTATAATDRISLYNANEIIIEFSYSVVNDNESNVRGTVHFKFSPNYTIFGQTIHDHISRFQIGGSTQYVTFLARMVRFTGDHKINNVSFGDCHVYQPSTASVTTSNDLLVPQAIYRVGDIYKS